LNSLGRLIVNSRKVTCPQGRLGTGCSPLTARNKNHLKVTNHIYMAERGFYHSLHIFVCTPEWWIHSNQNTYMHKSPGLRNFGFGPLLLPLKSSFSLSYTQPRVQPDTSAKPMSTCPHGPHSCASLRPHSPSGTPILGTRDSIPYEINRIIPFSETSEPIRHET
jgi:hypothetical protein